jgi:hypothetical protein
MNKDVIKERIEGGNENDSNNEEPIDLTNRATHHERTSQKQKQDSPRLCSDSRNQEKVNQNSSKSQVSRKI